jgi:hypothetical protein
VELTRLVTGAGTRRAIAPVCHVGRPGGEQARLPVPGADVLDAGLRADLVARGLEGLESTRRACAWVTRSGPLDLTDDDAAWFAAARAGFARHGVDLGHFLLLNRTGWADQVSGAARSWSRIRPLVR